MCKVSRSPMHRNFPAFEEGSHDKMPVVLYSSKRSFESFPKRYKVIAHRFHNESILYFGVNIEFDDCF